MLDRDRLRMARLGLRCSQESLGKAIGKDQSYISKLERGELVDITIQTLERLADALNVSTDYLLGRKDGDEAGDLLPTGLAIAVSTV